MSDRREYRDKNGALIGYSQRSTQLGIGGSVILLIAFFVAPYFYKKDPPPPVTHIMDSRFGNTVIATNDSVEWHYHFAKDGTFTAKELRSDYINADGTWKLDGQNVCLTFYFQPPANLSPNPDCKPVEDHKIGDTWSANDYQYQLVSGVQ